MIELKRNRTRRKEKKLKHNKKKRIKMNRKKKGTIGFGCWGHYPVRNCKH